jgi:ATP-dependent Lhr-like helicase
MLSDREEHVADDLHPKLLRYIADVERWEGFRRIQIAAYDPIISGQDTLLVAPTASGKTEAAFIPIFNKLLQEQPRGLVCLYLSPLKALINDASLRLRRWTNALNISLQRRHGDAKEASPEQLCNRPPSVLLTTPESLEVLLVYRNHEQRRALFEGLRFVVVDEIHSFLQSERGSQLSSVLNRVQTYSNAIPQRIGLSATVGNTEMVAEWLGGPDTAVVSEGTGRSLDARVMLDPDETQITEALRVLQEPKILIFVKSRRQAEHVGGGLSRRFSRHLTHVHHSSVDRELRQAAESRFKSSRIALMTCTSTLELGIDIGDVGGVIHYEPPHSASAFVQRSGRSGRRSGSAKTVLLAGSPGEVLIASALIKLALQGQVENLAPAQVPKDVLLQQVLCMVLEHQQFPAADAWQLLRQAASFRNIPEADWWELVEFWERAGLIEVHRGQVSMGAEMERSFGGRNYLDALSTLPFVREFTVIADGRLIGGIDPAFAINALHEGSQIVLAGDPWIVDTVDLDRGKVYVHQGTEGEPPRWLGGGGSMSFELAQAMFQMLCEGPDDEVTASLDEAAITAMQPLLDLASSLGFSAGTCPCVFEPDQRRWTLITFAGDRANALLCDMARAMGCYACEAQPLLASFKLDKNISSFGALQSLWLEIAGLLQRADHREMAPYVRRPTIRNRFMRFLPDRAQREVTAEVIYDLAGLRTLMSNTTPVQSAGPVVDELGGALSLR